MNAGRRAATIAATSARSAPDDGLLLALRLRPDGHVLDHSAPEPPSSSCWESVAEAISAVGLGPTIAAAVERGAAAVARDGSACTGQYSSPSAERETWYEATIAPTVAGDVLVMIHDITARKAHELKIHTTARRLQSTLDQTIQAMGTIVALRDPHTAGHERSVVAVAAAIATELGLDAQRRRDLLMAGEVHDIGKIVVPAEILSRPGPLTLPEMKMVREHPEFGYQILAGIDFRSPIAEVVRQHHERLDGSGYPRGLKRDAILLEARILAVADTVAAMTSHRPYRPARSIAATRAELRRGAGRLYDGEVVNACLRAIESGALDGIA